MPQNREDVIQHYVEDAIAAEQAVEAQLRGLAEEGDDDEAKVLLREASVQAKSYAEQLRARFADRKLNGPLKTIAANALAAMPKLAQLGHIAEERTVQNLIAGHSMQMAGCGMFRALQAAAEAAGDIDTARIAEQAVAGKQDIAARLFHLIPTRSIIVYNMLTLAEVDPAVETKYRQASWSE